MSFLRSLKKLKVISGLLVSLGLTCQVSLAGAGSSGGGSLVEVDGHLVPADLFYTPSQNDFSGDQKINFKDYPKALEAFQYVLSFLRARSHGADAFSKWDFEHTEFYFVSKLSGQDLLPVEEGKQEKQVSFTYEIMDYSGDHKPTRIIIEVLKDLFDQLSPENQALILAHEFMHHKTYGQHWVISPIIQSLNDLVPVSHRQDSGDRSALSDGELHSSQLLQNIIGAVTGDSETVTRNGGGIVRGLPSTDTNFVGITSRLSCSGDCVNITNNALIGSDVRVDFVSTVGNNFVRSDLEVKGVEADDRNALKNSLISVR